MGRPHKYADVIKAWADGEEIQFRAHEWRWNTWSALTEYPEYGSRTGIVPSFGESLEWRVKPKHKWLDVEKAHLAGEQIQFRQEDGTEWGRQWHDVHPYYDVCNFTAPDIEWRIKPKVTYGYFSCFDCGIYYSYEQEANLKVVYEDGKPVSAEIINDR
jgi:hypothetical protein